MQLRIVLDLESPYNSELLSHFQSQPSSNCLEQTAYKYMKLIANRLLIVVLEMLK